MVADPRIVVLGRSGQLARHLQILLPGAIHLGREQVDLGQPGAAHGALERLAPDFIVNAAAYTAVDAAEDDGAMAHQINASAVAEVAAAAHRLGVPLIHVSTDYVFDGALGRDYVEDDEENPVNVYGMTKLAGETAVRSLCDHYWILRTSWLFSEYGSNFVKTMLRLGAERDEVRVISDQQGRPTYAGDLAALIARLVRTPSQSLPYGVYHVSGGRQVSWAEFAEQIFQEAHSLGVLPTVPVVARIASAEYPTRAVRPRRTIMDGSRIRDFLGPHECDWECGLREVVHSLMTGRPEVS